MTMQYRRLGNTDLMVSVICLGTMTWGEQNTEAEAQAQLNYAVEQGINFIDTAELYAIPPKSETYGLTEQHLGNWLKISGLRDKLIIATKVTGPSENFGYMRPNFPLALDRKNLEYALDHSLRRLQTDYIDLYQIHWPDRSANYFGELGYLYRDDPPNVTPIAEVVEILGEFVRAGKVRHVGVSNETPWGVMTYLHAAKQQNLSPIVSIQNPYNLLNRTFEIGLAEISHREAVGLLAYSPLAFGALSGKYLNGQRPPKARLTLYSRFTRYLNPLGQIAIEQYCNLARRYGLDPAQMALAFVNSRPFVTANIIGATTLEQLATNIASIDLTLSDEVIGEIEKIHQQHPNPCP